MPFMYAMLIETCVPNANAFISLTLEQRFEDISALIL
jgi:hypothetical protein